MAIAGYIILAVASLASVVVGWFAGTGIPYAEQVQLLRELREVSTIIFGIMGAWSAIVYPEELKRRLRATETNALDPETLDRFRKLMRCILLSAGIVGVILAMQFAAPMLQQIPWIRSHALYFRSASFACACVLGIVQIWVVLLMLVPINASDADVRAAQEAQRKLAGGPQGKPGVQRV